MGFDKVIGAARVLHSENVSELMEAMAEDARDARARRNAAERNRYQAVHKPADQGVGEDAFFGHEDVSVPRRTAA